MILEHCDLVFLVMIWRDENRKRLDFNIEENCSWKKTRDCGLHSELNHLKNTKSKRSVCHYVWYLQKISLFFFRNEGPFLHGFFKFLTHYCVIERQYIRHCISFLILYKFQALYFCIPKKLENNSSHYYSTYIFLYIWRSKTLFKIYDFLANFQCVSRERETSQKSIFSNLLLTQNDKII